MRNFKKETQKNIIFCVIVFLVLNIFLLVCCAPLTSYNIGLKEIQNKSNEFDTVFIGSSTAYIGLTPEILEQKLNSNKFICVGSDSQRMPSTLTVAEELFKYQNPKQLVFILESRILAQDTCEPPLAAERIYPVLKDWTSRVRLFIRSTHQDNWFARILKWPYMLIDATPRSLAANLYHRVKNIVLGSPLEVKPKTYLGYGFSSYDYSKSDYILDYNNIETKRKQFISGQPLDAYSLKLFTDLINLCDENNCKLILVLPSMPSFDILEDKTYEETELAISNFANRYNTPCFNLAYAKPELLNMVPTDYRDFTHVNRDGAKKASYAICQLLNEYNAGKDVSQYFYNYDEYAASIDYVTNTWFTYTLNKDYIKSKAITVKAESSYGTTIMPEYQFLLVNKKTNQEQVLRDYATDCEYSFKLPNRPQDYEIKVKARPVGDDNSNNVRYSTKPILEY